MEYLDNHIDSKLKLLFQNKEKSENLRILLTVSGGVDSMVMANVMTKIREKFCNINAGSIVPEFNCDPCVGSGIQCWI